jgi:hypothetical protein
MMYVLAIQVVEAHQSLPKDGGSDAKLSEVPSAVDPSSEHGTHNAILDSLFSSDPFRPLPVIGDRPLWRSLISV